jgi:hypothetical protein
MPTPLSSPTHTPRNPRARRHERVFEWRLMSQLPFELYRGSEHAARVGPHRTVPLEPHLLCAAQWRPPHTYGHPEQSKRPSYSIPSSPLPLTLHLAASSTSLLVSGNYSLTLAPSSTAHTRQRQLLPITPTPDIAPHRFPPPSHPPRFVAPTQHRADPDGPTPPTSHSHATRLHLLRAPTSPSLAPFPPPPSPTTQIGTHHVGAGEDDARV